MTASELREALDKAGYPATFEVDNITYLNAELAVKAWLRDPATPEEYKLRGLVCGPNGGLMFKGVELIWTKKPST